MEPTMASAGAGGPRRRMLRRTSSSTLPAATPIGSVPFGALTEEPAHGDADDEPVLVRLRPAPPAARPPPTAQVAVAAAADTRRRAAQAPAVVSLAAAAAAAGEGNEVMSQPRVPIDLVCVIGRYLGHNNKKKGARREVNNKKERKNISKQTLTSFRLLTFLLFFSFSSLSFLSLPLSLSLLHSALLYSRFSLPLFVLQT